MPLHRLIRRSTVSTASAAIVVAALAGCSASAPVASAYDTVQVGDVATGVSASGALAAATTEQLGFPLGGLLKQVNVKVGQHVQAGQVLARIDDRVAQHTLEAAEANLDAQAAGLGRTTDSPAVASAHRALEQARQILAATKHQRSAIRRADQAAVSRAGVHLSSDRKVRDAAEKAVDGAQAACGASGRNDAAQLSALAGQQLQAGDTTGAAQTLDQLSALLATQGGASSPCAQLPTVQAALSAAQQRVVGDQTALTLAKRKADVDAAGADLTVQTSTQAVVSSQAAYDAAAADRPHSLDQQQALVSAAQAQVDSAQKSVDDTVLRAPAEGTVAALNGAVGEYLAPSSGTSALAPGSRAAIPGATGASATGATGATPTRPGGSQFIVLTGVDQLQLVLPFEESDAAALRAGQQVQIQLDALPGLSVTGKVLSVAPSATPIAGVINYYASVRLDRTDSRLRDGQTARATVLTAQHSGVLTVANSALRSQGGAAAVIVADDSGAQRVVAVKTGLVGPERTEITAGLSAGQRVVVAAHP